MAVDQNEKKRLEVLKEKSEHLQGLVDQSHKNEAKDGAKKAKNKSVEVLAETDEPIPPPTPTQDMFYGLSGEVGRTASDGTEINPVSAALAFLSFLGANVGRDTYLLINNTYHHPRLFTLHIGRSSRGGKGDSQQLTHRIRRRIEDIEPDLLGKTHTGGLSSGEGLAALVHDGYGETPPIKDKRLWVVEGELANVLKKIAREGNVLSVVLREMWDGSDIRPAVKTRSMGVTDPHIGLHACITPTELTKTLGKGEIDNGFANRFLMIWAENIGCVPFPETTQEHVIDALAALAIDVIKYSLGNYPESSNSKEMNLSEAARLFYGDVYRQYKQPLDNEQVAGLLARRAPYTIRLAMLFALMDKTRVIEVKHLKAAYAWVDYATNTTRFVFHSERQTEKATETKKNAVKILNYIEEHPNGCSSSEITSQCFKGNLQAAKIKEALSYLLTENPPLIERMAPEKSQKGRPKVIYRVKKSTKKTKEFKGHEQQGIQGGFNVRNNTKEYEINTPKNGEKVVNSYSFVQENDEKHPSRPHGTAFFVNSFNSYPIYSGQEPETPENEPTKPDVEPVAV